MKISVRSLCEFSARQGSLDFRYTPSPTALEGMAGHITVQARRADPYVAEYPLKGECEGLQLGGRVDGYYASSKRPYLEEIKTHRGDLKRIGTGLRGLHWAQLKVYGALLCQRDKRETIRLKLTYFEVIKERERAEELEYSAEELWQFTRRLCRHYRQWAEQEQVHRQQRDRALVQLAFPFGDFRHGQRTLSETVYKAAATGRALLLQAPTGLGKTVGVVYPALMAMPRQELDRIFFLSCRNTGRRLALDGLQAIADAQTEAPALRVLELCAREHACEHLDLACHGESCPLANGFFDRLDKAREDAAKQQLLDQSTLRDIALRHDICPYFLAQEMARWCDVVVGDVNHYFDQQALLHALSVQHEWRVLPLVDEAHNLIDRARGMYSTALSQAPFMAARKRLPKAIARPLGQLNKAWRELCDAHLQLPSHAEGTATRRLHYLEHLPDGLNLALQGLIKAIIDHLSEYPGDAELQSLLFDAAAFLRLGEVFGEHSIATLQYAYDDIGERVIPGSAVLAIENLIPADHLRARFAQAHSCVLFSATLSPGHFYRDVLGLPEDSHWQDIESPFHAQQLELRLIGNISTQVNKRTESIGPIVDRIEQQYRRRPGNYLVYLSSFAYLDALHREFVQRFPTIPVVRQGPGMNPTQRQEFIDTFRRSHGSVGFAVLGGVFSEGIDLPGEQLIGVFVATLGLPPFDHFHALLRERLESRFGDGYRYTYLYPGLRKVVQAAGRLIRTPEDRGIIELIDARYLRKEVNAMLPSWWQAGPETQRPAGSPDKQNG